MRPVPPDYPFPLGSILGELQAGVMALLNPGRPARLWSVAYADLPPAADWAGCIVYVSDKNKVGLSNGTTWTDPAGGAL